MMETLFYMEVSDVVARNLANMASKAGVVSKTYVQRLWEAAYSARCAPTGDAALDAAVAAIDKQPAAPSNEAAKSYVSAEMDALRAKILEIGQAVAAKDSEVADLARELAATQRRADRLADDLRAEKERARVRAEAPADAAKALERETRAREISDQIKAVAHRDLDAAKAATAKATREKAKAEEDAAMARNALSLASAEVIVLRDQLAAATAKPRVADPEAKQDRTPQQEADLLSRSMVAQAKSMYLRDEPLAAIARWAEVSTEAMRIILGLKTMARA